MQSLESFNFLKSFNPLPSHEGRLSTIPKLYLSSSLSIHFPLTREDDCDSDEPEDMFTFNPLPSHEGRRET